MQPAEKPVFWGYVRTPAGQRDTARLNADAGIVADLWQIIDRRLQGRDFLEIAEFALADLVLGAYARHWYGHVGELARPILSDVERWYQRVSTRTGFRQYLGAPLS